MKTIKAVSVFVLSCLFYLWIYPKILFDYFSSLLRSYDYLIQNPFVALFFILFASIITLLIYLQITNKVVYQQFIYSLYVPYILLLSYVLFGRNHAYRGFELNPLAFVSYFSQPSGGTDNLMNILLFVPIGILICRIPLKRAIPVALFSILLIETIQFTTHSGVFDLSDVLLNFSGMYLGIMIGTYFVNKGVTVVSSKKQAYRLSDSQDLI